MRNKHDRNTKFCFGAAGALLALGLLVILLAGHRGIAHNCFNVTDFGILQQGIYNFSIPDSLNPERSVRGVKVLNDHFDPIMFIAKPWSMIFDYHPTSLIFFEWFWFFLLFPICYLLKKKDGAGAGEIAVCFFLLFFCRGLLAALNYPIHPSTWAMTPLFLVSYYMGKNKTKEILVLFFLLAFYREIFPILAGCLGLWYALIKQYKKAFLLIVLAALFGIIVFLVRPLLVGPMLKYGDHFIGMILENPFKALYESVVSLKWGALIKLLLPFVFPIGWILKKEAKDLSHPAIGVIFMLSPLFLLHILANQFMNHYGVSFVAPLLGIIIFSTMPKLIAKKRALALIVLIPFFATSTSSHTKIVQKAFFKKIKSCDMDSKKLAATKKMLSIKSQFGVETQILASGGVIPLLIRPQAQIFHINSWIKTRESYDLMIYERNQTGRHHPLDGSQIEKIIKSCKLSGGEILMDDHYYFVMKGPIKKSCLQI